MLLMGALNKSLYFIKLQPAVADEGHWKLDRYSLINAKHTTMYRSSINSNTALKRGGFFAVFYTFVP